MKEKRTRIPAEDPDEVRDRDKAKLDSDLAHLGGERSTVNGQVQKTDTGWRDKH